LLTQPANNLWPAQGQVELICTQFKSKKVHSTQPDIWTQPGSVWPIGNLRTQSKLNWLWTLIVSIYSCCQCADSARVRFIMNLLWILKVSILSYHQCADSARAEFIINLLWILKVSILSYHHIRSIHFL